MDACAKRIREWPLERLVENGFTLAGLTASFGGTLPTRPFPFSVLGLGVCVSPLFRLRFASVVTRLGVLLQAHTSTRRWWSCTAPAARGCTSRRGTW
eukprot:3623102-Pyramimonas_sp.AAC.1